MAGAHLRLLTAAVIVGASLVVAVFAAAASAAATLNPLQEALRPSSACAVPAWRVLPPLGPTPAGGRPAWTRFAFIYAVSIPSTLKLSRTQYYIDADGVERPWKQHTVWVRGTTGRVLIDTSGEGRRGARRTVRVVATASAYGECTDGDEARAHSYPIDAGQAVQVVGATPDGVQVKVWLPRPWGGKLTVMAGGVTPRGIPTPLPAGTTTVWVTSRFDTWARDWVSAPEVAASPATTAYPIDRCDTSGRIRTHVQAAVCSAAGCRLSERIHPRAPPLAPPTVRLEGVVGALRAGAPANVTMVIDVPSAVLVVTSLSLEGWKGEDFGPCAGSSCIPGESRRELRAATNVGPEGARVVLPLPATAVDDRLDGVVVVGTAMAVACRDRYGFFSQRSNEAVARAVLRVR